MDYYDPITNWSFKSPVKPGGKPPPGGIVLQNVTHDGHNFARDIRVIGFWIETVLVDPSGRVGAHTKNFYILDSSNFQVSDARKILSNPISQPAISNKGKTSTFDYLFLKKETDAALDFSVYFKDSKANYAAYGLTVSYNAPGLFKSFPNCEYAGLSLDQIFLFSQRSNMPAHEPSGALYAARFHPLIHYTFLKNEAFNNKKPYTHIISIRFDYRLYFYVDRHNDATINARLKPIGNQAGLFADSDFPTFAEVDIGLMSFGEPVEQAVSYRFFDAVEKPLVSEVAATGLESGFPAVRKTTNNGSSVDRRFWDNVHWWGSRGKGAPIISAPGAFHAVHMHWRWGAVAEAAPGPSPAKNPVFNPNTYPAGMRVNPAAKGKWGPLVDPGIWIQSLHIAVVKNKKDLDPEQGDPLKKLSTRDWESLFTKVAPEDLTDSDAIVLWYAVQVQSQVIAPSSSNGTQYKIYSSKESGTVFVHGCFFAHDWELEIVSVGPTTPEYRPSSQSDIGKLPAQDKWVRPASITKSE